MLSRIVVCVLPVILFLSGCGITPTHKGRWVHISSKDHEQQSNETPSRVGPREKQLFVVIDDFGLEDCPTDQFLRLPMPITIAVLPHMPETDRVLKELTKHPNKELILHQPMEAMGNYDPGVGAIYFDTDPADVPAILASNLRSVKGSVGVNNHMGSKATENEAVMAAVLKYCRDNNLFFLDSKTAFNSVVGRVGEREHMHIEERDVFLDIRHDREYVQKAWNSTVEKAEKNGYAIAIGHVSCQATLDILQESYEDLTARGFTFLVLSELYE